MRLTGLKQMTLGQMEKTSLVELQQKIGNAVAMARREQGLTQQALAHGMGTRQANISRIERGLQNLSLDLLMRLDQELGLSLQIELSKNS
jgi:transcriptional regulator with XRE-family HTH domain